MAAGKHLARPAAISGRLVGRGSENRSSVVETWCAALISHNSADDRGNSRRDK
ncbi:hypothetical protein SSCG_00787 [Streptomyces clavuligerus]|nr:hypothetical protein SSCG_00787 [Streptomyces clavuligerus]